MYFDEIDQVCNLGARPTIAAVEMPEPERDVMHCEPMRKSSRKHRPTRAKMHAKRRRMRDCGVLNLFIVIRDFSQGAPQQNCGERWLSYTYNKTTEGYLRPPGTLG